MDAIDEMDTLHTFPRQSVANPGPPFILTISRFLSTRTRARVYAYAYTRVRAWVCARLLLTTRAHEETHFTPQG